MKRDGRRDGRKNGGGDGGCVLRSREGHHHTSETLHRETGDRQLTGPTWTGPFVLPEPPPPSSRGTGTPPYLPFLYDGSRRGVRRGRSEGVTPAPTVPSLGRPKESGPDTGAPETVSVRVLPLDGLVNPTPPFLHSPSSSSSGLTSSLTSSSPVSTTYSFPYRSLTHLICVKSEIFGSYNLSPFLGGFL